MTKGSEKKEAKNRFWKFGENAYSAEKYSLEEAKRLSQTLRDCHGCIDCQNCVSCNGCRNCDDCVKCEKCQDCVSCLECRDCLACDTCIRCNTLLACAFEKGISRKNGFDEDFSPDRYKKSEELKRKRISAYEKSAKIKEKKIISVKDIIELSSLQGLTVAADGREYNGCSDVPEGYMLRNAYPPYPRAAEIDVTSMGYVEMAFIAEENVNAIYRDEYFADVGEGFPVRIMLYIPSESGILLSANNEFGSLEQAEKMIRNGWKKKGAVFEKIISLKDLKENALEIYRVRSVIFPPVQE